MTEISNTRGQNENENLNEELAASMTAKLRSGPHSSFGSCIFRVPEKLRKVNEDAYVPVIVSIGPFHRDTESLKPMEEHKWRYLSALIHRQPEVISLKDFIRSVRRLEEGARKCYAESINFNSNEFVEMMVLDGCFILECFFRHIITGLRDEDNRLQKQNSWMHYNLRRDLILIENQLPFFVLKCLFDLISLPNIRQDYSLTDLAIFYLRDRLPDEDFERSDFEGKHLLDILRNWYILSIKAEAPQQRAGRFEFIHNLTELRDAGVRVKASEYDDSLDIKFTNGVLEMPSLTVEDLTEPLFRNLIAYEQFCDVGTCNYITDYISFMDSLINSGMDVAVLHRNKIIENLLGDDEEVANLFNKLGREVVFDYDSFYYAEVCEEANAYRRSRWHVWKAILRRTHFNTPWTVLSLIGAILLLILTFLQTLFSILSYSPHKSKS